MRVTLHRDGEDWALSLDKTNPHYGFTAIKPHPIAENEALRFVVQLHLAGHRLRGFLINAGRNELSGHGTDGSWCTVALSPDSSGLYRVAQGGPQRLWDTVETAHQVWQRLGEPSISRFGVTADEHPALQHVWVDDADSENRWPLPL